MTELVHRRSLDTIDGVTRDWVSLMAPAVELAKHVATTSFVPDGLRNNPPAIVAAILYGDEVGLGPMQALSKIAVINGRPTLAAEAQRALILAAGHDLWIVEANNTRVTVAGRRQGSDQTSTVTWTLDDAKRANLAGKQNWRMYPRQMLLARATAELARLVFADAIGGLLSTEEIEEPVDTNGTEPATETAGATTKRRRRNVTQRSETSAEPPPVPVPDRELPPLPGEEDIPFGEPEPADDGEIAYMEEGDRIENDAEKRTGAQTKKLNVLVGRLRDQGHITTEQLWHTIATGRRLDLDIMDQLLEGRDQNGVLHWAPLRDSLTKDEASSLIDRLERYEQNLAGAEG